MYNCNTVRKHDHACSECPLLQVFENALVVGPLGSGPRLVGRIGLEVRISVSLKKMPSCGQWRRQAWARGA